MEKINDSKLIKVANQIWEGDVEFDDLSNELKMNKKFALILLKGTGAYLEDLDESFKKDKEIVLVAVTQDGENLQFADE